jgi:K+-sensing histidine kinase KdpD
MAQLEKNFDRRPDPDALLALTDQESGAKLRVFLGAAPGVGKTYAMLARARALKLDGVDVLVGLVETHGRQETEILTDGLDILPRRKLEYRGRTIEEFDIDAALARKPKLIIVDELAHTNAPDSRRPKRWQDVEELLNAGVNVWTAVNIQHLESLADVVSRITGVAVRETVPDRVLQEAAEIVRRSRDIPVLVVMDDHTGRVVEPPRWSRLARLEYWTGIGAALISVAIAVGIGRLLELWLRLPNLSMVFLIPVIFCAVRFGLSASIAASLLSFLAFDFFFVDPRSEFTISQPHEFLSLITFLLVAVITAMLASRVREQSVGMRTRAEADQSLFEFSRKLSAAVSLDEVLWAAAAHAQKTLDMRCIVLLRPTDGELSIQAARPPVDELDPGEAGAARWTLEKSEAAAWRTGTLPNVRFQFRPLTTPRGVVGVCGFEPKIAKEPLSAQDERVLTSILEQTAIAIDRSLLVNDSVKAEALRESEKLRTILLASLSHDLRTPLASITGAVTSLETLGDKMPASDRQDLLACIREEAGRLNRFIANLLDMSRIESGAIAPRRDLVDVATVVRGAVERCKRVFPAQITSINIARDLPLIRGDANLLEQVLFNLLDNAHKYGADSGVIVHGRREDAEVVVTVTDEGPGVKPTDLERIFEKFYRGGRPDGRKAGTGLGLSICRGLVEAMGGTIIAQSPAIRRRGTRIIRRFPMSEEPREGCNATYVERPHRQVLFSDISSSRNGAVICPAFQRGHRPLALMKFAMRGADQLYAL